MFTKVSYEVSIRLIIYKKIFGLVLSDACCDLLIYLKQIGDYNVSVLFQNNMSVDGKEDYSDLPPNQKKKKLQAKVSELQKQVSARTECTLIYNPCLFTMLSFNCRLSVCG